MRTISRIAVTVAPLVLATSAHARAAPQTPADGTLAAQSQSLGQCMVDKTTGGDRIAVARWMLGAMASGPQMTGLVTVNPAQKMAADKAMAAIFTRLLATDCATQARPLFQAKSREGFETAFRALGEIAVKELLNDNAATASLEAFTRYLKDGDFAGVAK